MDTSFYMNLCLKMIEEKFDHGSSDDWTHKIFVNLSDEISKKTTIYISVSSLKRLYGKVKYDSSPQKYTLNALVKYLDYEDWKEFKTKNNPNREEAINKKSGFFRTKTGKVFLIAIVIAGILAVGVFVLQPEPELYDDVKFTAKSTSAQSPFNLVVNYDISMLKKENAYIYFNDFLEEGKLEQLPKNKHTITHTYLYGDYCLVQLIIEDSVVKEIPVVVKTNGWQHIIALYDIGKYYTVNKPKEDIENHKLFVSPEIIKDNGVDTIRDYWLKHRWVSFIDHSADNFILETRLRNVNNPGKINCPEVDLTVLSGKGSFKFKIFNPGCGSLHTVHRFGEVTIEGKYHDLSEFERDLSEWQNVKMEVKNKHVDIYINNTHVFDTTYTQPAGKLYGLLLGSKRSAEYEYFKITDLKGNVLLDEDFRKR